MRVAYKAVDDELDGFLGSDSDPACKFNISRDARMGLTFGERFLGRTLEFHLDGQNWSSVIRFGTYLHACKWSGRNAMDSYTKPPQQHWTFDFEFEF